MMRSMADLNEVAITANSEAVTCSTCSGTFYVGKDEVDFLQRIRPKFGDKVFDIPRPVDCPDCRLRLRVLHRNEQYLYRGTSAFSGAPLITLYSPNSASSAKYKVVSYEEWWADTFDSLQFGRDFDFARPFFEQFAELDRQVPRVNLMQVDNENSPYTTGTGYCKNCHLINSSENCEDCYYGKLIQSSRDVMDSSYVYVSELLYECFNVKKCYNCVQVSYSQNCTDCLFSENLSGCRNCFLCTDLHGKEFYILNKPVSKEDYFAIVNQVLGSREQFTRAKEELTKLRQARTYKYANIINCENSSGDFLTNDKNCNECYDVNDSQDSKYVTVGVNVKDNYDCSNMYLKPELCYQTLGTIGVYNVHFSFYVFHSQNVWYSQSCFNSRNLFGCSGLHNKEYCILNKQYTKEAYEELVPRIIEHMGGEAASAQHEREAERKSGFASLSDAELKNKEWGSYFPASLSPFGYNETVAQEYLPLTKDQAIARGFYWNDELSEKKDVAPQTYRVPDLITDVADDILSQVLVCGASRSEHGDPGCGKNFKIISQELARLRTLKAPIPEFCPDCRHRARMSLRNPRKLFDRVCSKCGASIKSTFTSEDTRKIYCEKCYQQEVY